MTILESIHHSPPFSNEDTEVQRSHLLAQGHMATKEPLDKGEREKKADLKLSIHKTRITTFSPITSWQIDSETMDIVTDFIFLGSKITIDGDCSLEIKRRLLFGRKAMTNPDSILKSRATLCQQRSIESKLWFLQQSCMDVRAGP